jgi:hypothetical protein
VERFMSGLRLRRSASGWRRSLKYILFSWRRFAQRLVVRDASRSAPPGGVRVCKHSLDPNFGRMPGRLQGQLQGLNSGFQFEIR